MSRRSESKTSPSLMPRLLAGVLALGASAAAVSTDLETPRDARLEVTDAGRYILDGQPVALEDLRAKLRELKSGSGPINLHVNGGPKVPYSAIMPVIQIAQEEGLAKVGVITVPPTAADLPASRAQATAPVNRRD